MIIVKIMTVSGRTGRQENVGELQIEWTGPQTADDMGDYRASLSADHVMVRQFMITGFPRRDRYLWDLLSTAFAKLSADFPPLPSAADRLPKPD